MQIHAELRSTKLMYAHRPDWSREVILQQSSNRYTTLTDPVQGQTAELAVNAITYHTRLAASVQSVIQLMDSLALVISKLSACD